MDAHGAVPTFLQRRPNQCQLEWFQSTGEQEEHMTKVVQCDCGFIAKSDSDAELIEQVQKHAQEVHDMRLTADQVLAMAKSE